MKPPRIDMEWHELSKSRRAELAKLRAHSNDAARHSMERDRQQRQDAHDLAIKNYRRSNGLAMRRWARLFALVALIPVVGVVMGPLAMYTARRAGRLGVRAWFSMLFGLIGFVTGSLVIVAFIFL